MEEKEVHDATAVPNAADLASSEAIMPSKSCKTWSKDFNYKEYIALKRGKERKAYLMSFGRKYGLQLPTTTTTTQMTPCLKQTESPKTAREVISWSNGVSRKEYSLKKPGKERRDFMANYKTTNTESKPKKLVPQHFAWPNGMNRKEFLAKKPGKDRMTYLARYIQKNSIELRETTSQLNLPIGRQPEPRAHPHCGCFSSEACASCSKCMELHCICGLTGRQRRAVCRESRACSCSLMDPTARCKLCHGCRQPYGFSHCRCVLHQRHLWQKRYPELVSRLKEEEEENVCSCFLLAHRHGGADATRKKEADALKETERVQRIKRATGFSSCDNIYRNKKVTAFLGDEGLESDFDDGMDNGLGSEVFPPSTESVIPRSMTRRLLDPEYNPASYHPLFRSEGCSLLESIEPRGGRISRKGNAAFNSVAIQGEISRGLENIAFEIDRNEMMPSDDLVEFLVYMASIKSVNVGELIGTFDDTAAVAASIVIEEYVAQLMEDIAVKQEALCHISEASVQAFARDLLVGFNWRLFEQQCPFTNCDTVDRFTSLLEKEATLKNILSALILQEFLSTQPKRFDVTTGNKNLSRWIQNAIEIPSFVLIGHLKSTRSFDGTRFIKDHSSDPARRVQKEHRIPTARPAHSTPDIRLSVKTDSANGNPVYKLKFEAMLEDGHHIKTSVSGLDSKIKARSTISQLANVVKRQEQRGKGILEDPLQAPGPPPVPRPLPPQDPNDVYASMFEHVWGHFNAVSLQKWEESMDRYLSTKMPGWQTHRREADAKRQSTGSSQRTQKQRRLL